MPQDAIEPNYCPHCGRPLHREGIMPLLAEFDLMCPICGCSGVWGPDPEWSREIQQQLFVEATS